MEKFQWALLKALEFVNSRRPDLEIRANFLLQLQKYTKRKKVKRSEDWDQNLRNISNASSHSDTILQEQLISNTYQNAQVKADEPKGEEKTARMATFSSKVIKWSRDLSQLQ